MRSIWKGSVSFGLVNVPVKLYGATEDHDMKAHQVHNKDGGRIRYKRVYEDCGEMVENADIAKQYEHEDCKVILTADDLNSISEEVNKVIEVLEFIPAADLDPMMYDKPYYLAPEKGADKAYALLSETLSNIERVAIVTFAMRSKTRLAALRVTGKEKVIVAHTLRWPDEIRPTDFVTLKDVELKDKELDMAEKLVDSLANEFNPDRYRDDYQEQLCDLIAAKASGAEIVPAEKREDTEDVSDLLEKLEASLKKGKRK